MNGLKWSPIDDAHVLPDTGGVRCMCQLCPVD